MVFFLRPLYMAVTCSVLVCLRSACVDSSGRRLPEWFPYQWIHVMVSLRGRSGKNSRVIREVGPRIDSTRRVG